MKKQSWLILVIILLMASTAMAQVPQPIEGDGSTDDYWNKVGDKTVRGLSNVVFGWTQPIQDWRASDPEDNKVTTVLDGIISGANRTIVGGLQVATAFCPHIDWEGDAELSLD